MIDFLVQNAAILLGVAALILSGLAVLAKRTGNTVDDKIVEVLQKMVDEAKIKAEVKIAVAEAAKVEAAKE